MQKGVNDTKYSFISVPVENRVHVWIVTACVYLKFLCDLCQYSGVDINKEMTRYRVGLASSPISGFMVTYNKHTLGLEDLGTLEEQNWLNDQVRKEDPGVLSCQCRNSL